ncbi:hypothetical protein JB92DRAFT_2833105 [Gautieria morchelliformis]|nr:hypothetical protein JB92DRAFT_2833105 [Gautieria morchelliformis]
MPGSLRLFTYSSGVRVFAAQSPHGCSELQGASAVPHSALLGTIAVAASSIAQSWLLGGVHLLWSLWAVAAAYAVHVELSGMTHHPLPSRRPLQLWALSSLDSGELTGHCCQPIRGWLTDNVLQGTAMIASEANTHITHMEMS